MKDRFFQLKSVIRWFIVVGSSLVVATAAVLLWWTSQSHPLLPTSITHKITNFEPYFYDPKVPAGYSIDTGNITYDDNTLIIPLDQKNGPRVVVTEQPLGGLSSQQILEGDKADKVEGTAGQASISSVEGRLVGTLVPSDGKTLVLLNTPDTTDKSDMVLLLQRLRAIH